MSSSASRQRCVLAARCTLEGTGQPFDVRVLELSPREVFLEDAAGLEHAERHQLGTLTLPLPGGDPWTGRVQLWRPGNAQVDLVRPGVDHLTVSARGWRAKLVDLTPAQETQLVGYLELLDER